MKRKKILKIIFVVIIILLLFLLLNTLRKFIIIKDLQENVERYISSNNFHVKSIEKQNLNTIVTINYYKKDEKNLLIIERKNNDIISKISKYSDGSKVDIFYDSQGNKIVELNNPEPMIEFNMYNYLKTGNDWETFISSITSKIKTEQYDGKECYAIKNFASSAFFKSKDSEVYIEKDTGLLVKNIMDSSVIEMEYEFGNVNDSIFTKPDISEYTIKEK